MAERTPLKLGTTGAETFSATDTLPRTALPADAVISPSQITANQNDYSPTGFSTADVLRLDFDSTGKVITGLSSWTDGRTKTLVNVGSSYGVIAAEHPSSSAANRVAGYGDILLPPGEAVTFAYDGTSSRARAVSATFEPQSLGFRHKGLFLSLPAPSVTAGDNEHFAFATSGTAAAAAAKAPASGLPRGVSLGTGTTSTGACAASFLKDGEFANWAQGHTSMSALVYFPALSTSSQRFTGEVALALINGTTAALANRSGIGVKYSDNLNSGKFQLFSVDTSQVESTADSGVTVSANTLYLIQMVEDKALSEARFFINGSYVGRVTANQPLSGHSVAARATIVKSVGTTASEMVFCHMGFQMITN